MRALLLIAWLFSVASVAYAQDYPAGTHLFYGTTDNDSLLVRCDPPVNGSIQCKFVQTMVSRRSEWKDFEAELPGAIDKLLGEKNAESCGNIAEFAKAIRDGTIPPGVTDLEKYKAGMAKTTPEQKQDLLKMLDSFAAYCAKPNKTTAETMLRQMHDKESRTCQVSSNTYEQTFRKSDVGDAWLSNEGPTGDCGVIVISKLERSKGEYKMWVYRTQKVVTMKEERSLGLVSCAKLDEQEYFFDWMSDEKFLRCDYIKFGP